MQSALESGNVVCLTDRALSEFEISGTIQQQILHVYFVNLLLSAPTYVLRVTRFLSNLLKSAIYFMNKSLLVNCRQEINLLNVLRNTEICSVFVDINLGHGDLE